MVTLRASIPTDTPGDRITDLPIHLGGSVRLGRPVFWERVPIVTKQLDFFRPAGAEPVSAAILREERRLGRADAISGLGIRNYYSSRISGERLLEYRRAFREERAAQSARLRSAAASS
jgi:hypothetical protein